MSTASTPRPSDPSALQPAPLPVDWQSEEEDWQHHLGGALAEAPVEYRGYSVKLFRPPQVDAVYYELSVNSTPSLPLVRFYATPDGVVAALASEDTTHEQRVLWEDVLRKAVERLGGGHIDFPWAAYIADKFRTYVTTSAAVAGLELGASVSPYREIEDGPAPRFHGGQIAWCYPIKVTGTASGLQWRFASQQAGEALYRLCAVLSALEASTYWTVKHFAQPTEFGDLELPAHPGYLKEHSIASSGDNKLARREAELPPGLETAWQTAGDPTIAGPLSSHYRALAHQDDDPATAMSLFVAAIEGIGSRYVELQRCRCGQSRVGARRRFRYALRLLMTEEEATPLDEAYGLRSGAAHGDLIPGQPLSFDAFGRAGWFYSSPEDQLRSTVWAVRRASQRILSAALLGQLPPSEAGGAARRPRGD